MYLCTAFKKISFCISIKHNFNYKRLKMRLHHKRNYHWLSNVCVDTVSQYIPLCRLYHWSQQLSNFCVCDETSKFVVFCSVVECLCRHCIIVGLCRLYRRSQRLSNFCICNETSKCIAIYGQTATSRPFPLLTRMSHHKLMGNERYSLNYGKGGCG